jgi:metal-sulfur cluster biosynthetic enzyme
MTRHTTGRRRPLERRVLSALTTVRDPATPAVDIVGMGVVYRVGESEDGLIQIDLAFSDPSHPGCAGLPDQVAALVRDLEGVRDCQVRVVTDPPWTIDRLSDSARADLAVTGGND